MVRPDGICWENGRADGAPSQRRKGGNAWLSKGNIRAGGRLGIDKWIRLLGQFRGFFAAVGLLVAANRTGGEDIRRILTR
jgi:hypothetical protein